jgi:hypothetical protein
LHVLAAIDRDIGAGHERRPVRAQVDDKTCNFFGLAEASERDLRQDLSWDSPDDSRTGVNIIAFPSSLEDRREVRTATGTLGQPERVVERPIWPFFPGIGTVRSGGIALTMSLCSATGSWAAANSIASGIPSNFSQISATIAASASVSSNRRSTNNRPGS